MRRGRPLPSFLSRTNWHVYINNFHVDEFRRFHERFSEGDLPPLVSAWRASANESGALFSPDKALSRLPEGLNLGLWVNGTLGTASLPAESLADLVPVSFFV